MITYRKPDETLRDYYTREYSLCMERVDKYYVLQSLRRDQGYFGAALFYQNEAARWYKRAFNTANIANNTLYRDRDLRILNWNIG